MLDTFLAEAGSTPTGLIRFDGIGALLCGGRAALVPTSLLERSSGIERRCQELGAAIADGSSVFVDPGSGEAVVSAGLVGDRALGIDAPWLAAPGRYAVDRVHWTAPEEGAHDSPGATAVRLLGRITSGSPLDDEAFQGVLALAARTSDVVVGERGVGDLEAIIAQLSG